MGLGGLGAFALLAAAVEDVPASWGAVYLRDGLGASSAYPLMLAAAASRPGVRPGDGIALVSWVGRVGFLIAPPLVGVLADGFSLGVGVAVGVGASLGVAALAGTLRPRQVPGPRGL